MAEGLNRVLLLGNLGQDPELRMTSGGQAVLKMRLATSESYLDKNKVRQERTEWHSVIVWGRRAEGLGKFLSKGMRIFVEGAIRTSSYEQDGFKRYRTEVVAQNVIVAGSAPAGQRSDSRGGASDDADDYGGPSGGDDDIPF